MNTISISEARNQLPNLIKNISKYMSRAYITVNGKPKAALLSMEELESIEETAEILAIPGARESILKGTKEIENGEYVTLDELLKKNGK